MKENKNQSVAFEPSRAVDIAIVALNSFIATLFGLLLAAFVLHATRDPQRYFVYTMSSQKPITSEVQPLKEPNVNTEALLNWATTAATKTFTIDFVHYEQDLEEMREYFTQAGYFNFINSLNENGRIDDIVAKKLIVNAVPYNSPVIIQEGELQGHYAWRIQLPLLVNYQGASESVTQTRIVVTLLVTRVPTTEAVKGIGIAQITDQPIGGI